MTCRSGVVSPSVPMTRQNSSAQVNEIQKLDLSKRNTQVYKAKLHDVQFSENESSVQALAIKRLSLTNKSTSFSFQQLKIHYRIGRGKQEFKRRKKPVERIS